MEFNKSIALAFGKDLRPITIEERKILIRQLHTEKMLKDLKLMKLKKCST